VRRTLGIAALVTLTVTGVVLLMRTNAFRAWCAPEVEEIAVDTSIKELPPVKPGTGDWPWWRGGQGDSSSTAKDLPTEWSEGKNILWKSPVPGRGHASPVLFGERIFLATAEEEPQVQSLVCLDRASGKRLWLTSIHSGNFMRKHPKNSHASATPACDGQRVYVPFLNADALWVSATDLDGHIVWQTKAGPFVSEHGYGSSPVIYGSLVIVSGDSLGGGFLAALHRETGKIVWRVRRPNDSAHGSYGTPVVGQVAGKPQLLLNGTGKVTSYDPATGQVLWFCRGPAEVTGNTIACNEKYVVASGGYPEKEIVCVRGDGQGDVSDTHVVWRSRRGVAYVPSPLIAGDLVYLLQDSGVLSCLEVASGKQVYKQRVRGSFSASPVLAHGRLYLSNETGETLVIKEGQTFELVATNSLDEGTLATPAIAGGRIYLRTTQNLYCIGKARE
jgi:outer membrane protein assembly factor BamB